MMGRTHVLGGLSTLWLLQPVPGALTSDRLLPLCLLAALGALLPDLDAEVSLLSSVKIGAIRPLAPVSSLLFRQWGHRGPLHSPRVLAILLVPALLLGLAFGSALFGLALWLGYASHLALDACTKTGIPKWPRAGRLWLLPPALRFVTGSEAEDRLFLILGCLVILLCLLHLPLPATPTAPSSQLQAQQGTLFTTIS